MLAAALSLILVSGSPASAATNATYRLVDLGTLGGESSYATAFNDRGHVVGSAQNAAGVWHGFLWRSGRMTDLGTFQPTGINNRGEMIGADQNGTAYFRRGHRLIPLGGLGGSYTAATDLNDRGDVVGVANDAEDNLVPFRWSRGRIRALPLDTASGINNSRQISGGVFAASGGFHAAKLNGNRVIDLGAGPFNRSNTYRINDSGWVIGWKFTETQVERGTLWRGTRATDLGSLGGERTVAIAINDRGQIAGTSQALDGNDHPFLWQRGRMSDLTTRGVTVDGNLVGLNDRGDLLYSYRPVFGISRAAVYRR